jgi:hypothetical protein
MFFFLTHNNNNFIFNITVLLTQIRSMFVARSLATLRAVGIPTTATVGGGGGGGLGLLRCLSLRTACAVLPLHATRLPPLAHSMLFVHRATRSIMAQPYATVSHSYKSKSKFKSKSKPNAKSKPSNKHNKQKHKAKHTDIGGARQDGEFGHDDYDYDDEEYGGDGGVGGDVESNNNNNNNTNGGNVSSIAPRLAVSCVLPTCFEPNPTRLASRLFPSSKWRRSSSLPPPVPTTTTTTASSPSRFSTEEQQFNSDSEPSSDDDDLGDEQLQPLSLLQAHQDEFDEGVVRKILETHREQRVIVAQQQQAIVAQASKLANELDLPFVAPVCTYRTIPSKLRLVEWLES